MCVGGGQPLLGCEHGRLAALPSVAGVAQAIIVRPNEDAAAPAAETEHTTRVAAVAVAATTLAVAALAVASAAEPEPSAAVPVAAAAALAVVPR